MVHIQLASGSKHALATATVPSAWSISNKTKQNKTKQDKTRQNKTKQDKIRQNKTKQLKRKSNSLYKYKQKFSDSKP